jgi:hypothetical protein
MQIKVSDLQTCWNFKGSQTVLQKRRSLIASFAKETLIGGENVNLRSDRLSQFVLCHQVFTVFLPVFRSWRSGLSEDNRTAYAS